MTHTPTDRDRLLRAFAELNRHGILARPAGRRRPPSVTARPAAGATSPWRWLGPRTAVAARSVEAAA
jgi:hypothetical protein